MPSFATSLFLLAASGPVAVQPIEMNMQCQQNLTDGRILVADGALLPETARYRVKIYSPQRRADGWSYGPCTLVMTKGVSD